jgi:hypothetical protein
VSSPGVFILARRPLCCLGGPQHSRAARRTRRAKCAVDLAQGRTVFVAVAPPTDGGRLPGCAADYHADCYPGVGRQSPTPHGRSSSRRTASRRRMGRTPYGSVPCTSLGTSRKQSAFAALVGDASGTPPNAQNAPGSSAQRVARLSGLPDRVAGLVLTGVLETCAASA